MTERTGRNIKLDVMFELTISFSISIRYASCGYLDINNLISLVIELTSSRNDLEIKYVYKK
jgi:hypothetical protein